MHLNISPSSVHLAEVRRAARLVLRPLPTDVAQDLLLALDEAVSNAVKHGSAGGGPVEVSIQFSKGWVELRVVDRGPTAAVPALPANPPPPMALGGRGLWLIRQLADEVRVEAAGRGTLLSIRRRSGSSSARPSRPAWPVGPDRAAFDTDHDPTFDPHGWGATPHGPDNRAAGDAGNQAAPDDALIGLSNRRDRRRDGRTLPGSAAG